MISYAQLCRAIDDWRIKNGRSIATESALQLRMRADFQQIDIASQASEVANGAPEPSVEPIVDYPDDGAANDPPHVHETGS